MAVLIIDDTVREEIGKVIEYAKEHPTTVKDLLAISEGVKQAVGVDSRHSMVISNHYHVVYSLEHQPDGNTYHHLSISVPERDRGKTPSSPAVEMIMEEFGMGNDLKKCDRIWLEDNAVNVLKKIRS